MSKTNIVFSPSSLDLFLTCKKKFKFAHLLRKTLPPHEKPYPLDRGTLVHQGLEVYFNQLALGVHFNDRLHAALNIIKVKASDVTQSNVDITEQLPIILSSVEQSCTFWRFEDEQLEILEVEAPFDFVLYEDDYVRIIISGKEDLIVNKPSFQGSASYTNLPYDHKSSERSFPRDRLNNQFIIYTIPLNSNFLIVNEVGQQKTLKPEEKFKRIPLSFDSLVVEKWKKETIDIILNEYLISMTRDHFPMNTTACRKFGRLCEFHKVCNASGEAAAAWNLESGYVMRDPWDKYAEDGEVAV